MELDMDVSFETVENWKGIRRLQIGETPQLRLPLMQASSIRRQPAAAGKCTLVIIREDDDTSQLQLPGQMPCSSDGGAARHAREIRPFAAPCCCLPPSLGLKCKIVTFYQGLM